MRRLQRKRRKSSLVTNHLSSELILSLKERRSLTHGQTIRLSDQMLQLMQKIRAKKRAKRSSQKNKRQKSSQAKKRLKKIKLSKQPSSKRAVNLKTGLKAVTKKSSSTFKSSAKTSTTLLGLLEKRLAI